ncbi:MAG: very short patch repair endonuclease [Elusimicrobiota bacterium]|jgi:DNA mismatch endonuclease (patch repair protein)|nr:very short patch repair endonuclease [Elusimicrobiota bacterium]
MDNLTPQQRHKSMSRIKSNNTSVEVLLRKALWHEGIRYRKNFKTLPGKPDIVITKYKVVVFCDGELWHGKDWEIRKETIKTNRQYWLLKIKRNMDRDEEREIMLNKMGWVVVRFWGMDIKNGLFRCVNEIKKIIYEIKIGEYETDFYKERQTETKNSKGV